MARQSKEPESVQKWSVYYAGRKQVWLGVVDAKDGQAAIAVAAEEFNRPASKLIVVRRQAPTK